MNYKDFWDVIRKIDAENGVQLRLQWSRTGNAARRYGPRQTNKGRRRRMLKLKKLVKTYTTGDQALKSIDLEVPAGRVLALIRAIGGEQVDDDPLYQPAGRTDGVSLD